MKFNFKNIFQVLKNTFNEFIDDNCIKFSASLSYYTIFALPSLCIIIISITGYFFCVYAVTGQFFVQINEMVGDKAAFQIQEAVKNVKLSDSGSIATMIGIATLLFSASGVFAEIQSSINYIWGLKAKPKKGVLRFVINRLLSFSMIGAFGFILLVSLLINTLIEALYSELAYLFNESAMVLADWLNSALVFLIITVLFGFIFKTLPDGKIGFKETFIGSLFTAFLFMLGKWGIGLYLGSSDKFTLYGAAGSILIVLVWVYYSAIILYFGAVFTKNYSEMFGTAIRPNNYSVWIDKNMEEVPIHKENPNTNTSI